MDSLALSTCIPGGVIWPLVLILVAILIPPQSKYAYIRRWVRSGAPEEPHCPSFPILDLPRIRVKKRRKNVALPNCSPVVLFSSQLSVLWRSRRTRYCQVNRLGSFALRLLTGRPSTKPRLSSRGFADSHREPLDDAPKPGHLADCSLGCSAGLIGSCCTALGQAWADVRPSPRKITPPAAFFFTLSQFLVCRSRTCRCHYPGGKEETVYLGAPRPVSGVEAQWTFATY